MDCLLSQTLYLRDARTIRVAIIENNTIKHDYTRAGSVPGVEDGGVSVLVLPSAEPGLRGDGSRAILPMRAIAMFPFVWGRRAFGVAPIVAKCTCAHSVKKVA